MRWHPLQILSLVLVALALSVFHGCARDSMRPERPGLMSAGATTLFPYTLEEYKVHKQGYDDAIAAKDLPLARIYRDIMINRIRADIRANSGEFEDNLRQSIAEWSTTADFTELALAAATTITGGEQAKTVLAAVLTAVKGGRLSVDKNFFRERSSEALISALRSSRLRLDTMIVGKMVNLDVTGYTFEEAWNDLVDLYYAGTLASAFQTLAEQAGKRAEEARSDQEALSKQRAPILKATPESIDLMGRLYAALATMTDAQAQSILKLVNESASATPVRDLQALLRRMPPGDSRAPAFEAAYDRVLGTGNW